MYLNWRELLFVIAQNGHEYENRKFVEKDTLPDGGWCGHLARTGMKQLLIFIITGVR